MVALRAGKRVAFGVGLRIRCGGDPSARHFGAWSLDLFLADCYITQYRPIEQHVKQTETEVKRNQHALAAWKDCQQTGLHATLDQLDAWLATWGARGGADAYDSSLNRLV